jgi:hypothetical protein
VKARDGLWSLGAAGVQYVLAYAVALPVFVLHRVVRHMRMRRRRDVRPG